ncbi:hypothetical protein BH11PLA2_BH11PLA2_51710 [soil metagenome]
MNELRFTAGVNLTAAEAGKAPTFTMLAYTGVAMRLGSFAYPVVVDVAGVKAPRNAAILRDHDPAKIVGHSSGIDLGKNGSITVTGVVSGSGPDAAEIVASSKQGFPWQASIGASVERSEFVETGSKVRVNNTNHTGPLYIVRASELKEISFVAIGADAATSATIAAKSQAGKSGGKKGVMNFESYIVELGFEADSLTDTQRTALEAGWHRDHPQDGNTIPMALASGIGDLVAKFCSDQPAVSVEFNALGKQAIKAKWSLETLENKLMLAGLRGATPPRTFAPTTTAGTSADVIQASMLVKLGLPEKAVAASFAVGGERIVDAASSAQHRGAGIQTLLRATMRAAGRTPPSGGFGDGSIREAFECSRRLEASGTSVISVSGILSNAAHKLLLNSFNSVPMTWQRWCRVGSAANFKPQNRYRMTGLGVFEEVAAGGELKHVSLTESEAEANLKTYGALLGIDRHDIINDDLSAFASVPKALGRMSAIKIEKSVYETLLANAGSFFGTGNANYESGGGSVLAAAGLVAAYARFQNQTDANGDPTMLVPTLLIVPPALEITARQLTRDTDVIAVGVGATAATTTSGNPWAERFEPLPVPYLGTAFGLTGSSNTGWYLMVEPGDFSPVEVAFLNGQQVPTVETAELDFNRLGIQMRAYHDFGVSFLEHRGGVFSLGA